MQDSVASPPQVGGPFQHRQAVVLIHGVGDQRPMETLRGFVRGVIDERSTQTPGFYSKPDMISDTLELRRLSSWKPHVPIPTDFYELYWAHLMEGTSWQHVAAWFRMLLLRNPRDARWSIRWIWFACWMVLIGLTAYYMTHDLPTAASVAKYGLPGILLYAGLRSLLGSFGLHYVGDAARYLSPTPPNIAVRKAIRNAALALLRGLHDDPLRRYERIIVVGHSLGSVIAYDALTHLWQERHSKISSPQKVDQPILEEVRQRSASMTGADGARNEAEHVSIERYRKTQRALLKEEADVGVSWRISDLVTLGSPLAHAPFLMAQGLKDFQNMKVERQFPTSPPQLEDERDQGLLTKTIDFWLDKTKREVRILHHAALFACTRWTNLFFPGDLIGGPVSPLFGPGVLDLPLATRAPFQAWLPTSHVRYWHPTEDLARGKLKVALDLGDSALGARAEAS